MALADSSFLPTAPLHVGPHDGPWWEAWYADPEVLVPAGILVLLYVRGLDRWVERGRPHPWWRTALFLGGVVIALLAVQSPIDELGERHFVFHMIQHQLLMMVAVPMVLLGAPVTPVLRGLPRGARMQVGRLARSRVLRTANDILRNPLVAVFLSTLVIYVWHFVPGLYTDALRSQWLHDLEHVTFIAGATVLWWSVIDPKPLHAPMSYPARMVFLLAASTPQSFIAAFIAFADEPFYADWYGEVPAVLDITLEADQTLAGLMMWMPSQILFLFAVAVVFFVWYGKSRARDGEVVREQVARAGVS